MPVFLYLSCREEKQTSDSSKNETDYYTRLIAETFHEHCYRYGKQEVGQPIGRFSERGLESIQFTGFHQLPDHCRQQITADSHMKNKLNISKSGIKYLFFILTCF